MTGRSAREMETTETVIMTDVLGPTTKRRSQQRPRWLYRDVGRNVLVACSSSMTRPIIRTTKRTSGTRSFAPRSRTTSPAGPNSISRRHPRFTKGALFPWVISDYPIRQAILDNIVKRPVKGIAEFEEAKSPLASIKYQAYLTAGARTLARI